MTERYTLTTHRFEPPFRASNIQELRSRSTQIKSTANDVRLFRGIFGMPNNEFLTLSTGNIGTAGVELPGAAQIAKEVLEPTTRPKSPITVPSGGIIVMRWFSIDNASFDEFVALSDEAWISLEASFDCEILGLFRAEEAPDGKTRMLLYTWYASHAAWEVSRDARPEAGAAKAWQNFQRRHQLTDWTSANVVAEVPLD